MERLTDDEKRRRRNEYMKEYRKTHDRRVSDWKTNQSHTRKESEKLRKRMKYLKEKEAKMAPVI